MSDAPILTNTIDQSFFIEPINGASSSATFLDNFPDTVYNKSADSHLMILMYSLLGPSGVGLLRQALFAERLQTEASNLTDTQLDELYTGAFGFQRLVEESYLWDAAAQLLPAAQRAEVLSADASFRNRARLWLQAVRAGGSILGISLAASSGLGQNVEAVENYKALFDQYTDMPLGLPYLGTSTSLDEIILLPRNNIPQNVSQTLSFGNPPTSGEFTIVVPIGAPHTNVMITTQTEWAQTVGSFNPIQWWRLNDSHSSPIATNSVASAESGSPKSVSFGWPTSPIYSETSAYFSYSSGFGIYFMPKVYGHISTPYTPTNAACTVVCWFKTNNNLASNYYNSSLVDTRVATYSGGSYSYTGGYYIGFDGSGNLVFGLGNSATVATSSVTCTDSNWHFAAGTWDGTTLKLYVDANAAVTATPGATIGTASSLTMGNSGLGNNGHNFFNGYMSEVAVFGTTLTGGNVASLYASADIGSNLLDLPDTDIITVGDWISINGTTFYCTEILGDNLIQLNSAPALWSGNSQIGYSETEPINWNASAADVRAALGVLPSIGGVHNIQCYGGPLPYQPVTVLFTGDLANATIGPLIIKNQSETTPPGSSGLSPANADPQITLSIASTEADGLPINFSTSDLALMLEAVDILRPQTSFITVGPGQSLYTRQMPSDYYADTTYTEVQQYITGNPGIDWPPVDNTVNWIEADAEHEAPQLAGTYSSQYTNFHNILNVIAYTDAALSDPNYNTPLNAAVQPFYASYWDSHTGQFNQGQQLLYPLLAQFQNPSAIFLPTYAVAPQPNQPEITTVTDELVALVNDKYPTSYLNLPGANYQATAGGPFWASDEATTGVDYLEIDLGTVQAVNYIYFEATNKPYAIDVAYDSLDQPNAREFIPADISTATPSVTLLSYSASSTNPWSTVFLPITNSLDTMIYTRYIRIGFTRTSQGEPFQVGSNLLPYSIEVRNLRVGRVVNS